MCRILLCIVDKVKKVRVSSGKYRNIKKSRNKVVEILAKS